MARRTIDIEEYKEMLERRLGKSREVMRLMINQAKRHPKRIVLADGESPRVLRAAQVIHDEGFANPVLLGNSAVIRSRIEELDLHLEDVPTIDPARSPKRTHYAEALHRSRARKGMTRADADQSIVEPGMFGAMMVKLGDADALVAGIDQHYPDALRPALQVIGRAGVRAHSVHMMVIKDRVYFLSDTTVNIDPTVEELAEIAISTADVARRFHIEPRIAMLSFSNFGSVRHPYVDKVRRATDLVRGKRPDLMIEGEMQADTALVPELREQLYPFGALRGPANVLIFPDLNSANIGYKLLQQLGGAEAFGPILAGMRRPVHILQHGCGVNEVVYLTAIATVDAQDTTGAEVIEANPDTSKATTHEEDLVHASGRRTETTR